MACDRRDQADPTDLDAPLTALRPVPVLRFLILIDLGSEREKTGGTANRSQVFHGALR